MKWLCLLLMSCSHVVWRQDGAGQQKLTTDIYECDRDARAGGEELDLETDGMTGPIFHACMVERGWRPHPTDGYRKSGWRQHDLEGT